MQWTVLCTCYNYIYKQNIWHEYKVRSVGGFDSLPVSCPFILPQWCQTRSWSINTSLFSMPYLCCLLGLQWPSCPLTPFSHYASQIPSPSWPPDQMSSGSLSWFSHTPSLKVNIYLFLITLQFPNIVIFTVISVFPNIVNSKPSYPTVLEGTQRSWMKSTLLATRKSSLSAVWSNALRVFQDFASPSVAKRIRTP